MSGEANKKLKSMVCAGIVTLALAGGVREARAESHQNYFPLNVGNSWTYVDCNDGSTKTFTIIGTEKNNGHIYYKFDDYWGEVREGEEYLFRYEANRVLMWDSWWYNRHGEEVVRYDFTGGDYWDGGIYGICRLKRGDVSCNVPAGEFSDCINFQFLGMDCGPDCYGYGEYMAPNVGNVKYVDPGGECYGCEEKEGDTVTFELQSYRIVPFCGDANHPYPVGDLNKDCRVDMLDLAILISHWLECTAPECRGLEVTDVKIIRGELVEGWFEEIEEVNEVSVGDVFVIETEVSNLGSETEHVLNLYDWDLSPQNRVEVIGTPGLCLTYIELEPGESAFLYPFCLSQAFKAEQDGWVTMNIYVDDWYSGRLCEHRFTFEILPGK